MHALSLALWLTVLSTFGISFLSLMSKYGKPALPGSLIRCRNVSAARVDAGAPRSSKHTGFRNLGTPLAACAVFT